jgi:hypothetical protein
METIENRVANSGLLTIDLEEVKPNWSIQGFDIAQTLFQGLALRENDFRAFVSDFDWSQFEEKSVFIFCSADAIVPKWAYMLIGTQLSGIAERCIFGIESELKTQLWRDWIKDLSLDEYHDKRVVVKGCSKETISESIYTELAMKLTPVVKSLMFGEPCSTVPLFKQK